MEEPARKVVAQIVPPSAEPARGSAAVEDLWNELIAVKARMAEVMNEVRAQARELDDMRRYTQRGVKRVDALASKLTRAYANRPRDPR